MGEDVDTAATAGVTMQPVCGVVMAAFGERYVNLAVSAARSIQAVCPDLPVDLFTDRAVDGPFAQVHILEHVWIRAKLDAMLNSRFEKTLYLDVDIQAVADFTDIFFVLDRFDLAVTHDQNRNAASSRMEYKQAFPNAFPQLNGGVVALRRSAATLDFVRAWKAAVEEHDVGKDQPSLRELAWQTPLRIAVLPPEYNFWDLRSIDRLTPLQTAPRILHSNVFAKKPLPAGLEGQGLLRHYIGAARTHKLQMLLDADETLARRNGRPARLPSIGQRLRLLLLTVWGLPARSLWALQAARGRWRRAAR